ncbi:uncharacterized protein [Temnothorax nylanderi]|uniref:uncharacterized protein n=1 Tax=Temnothorax nylanderi TaxID=102681 RepID=UPI003A87F2A3
MSQRTRRVSEVQQSSQEQQVPQGAIRLEAEIQQADIQSGPLDHEGLTITDLFEEVPEEQVQRLIQVGGEQPAGDTPPASQQVTQEQTVQMEIDPEQTETDSQSTETPQGVYTVL